MLLLLRGGDGDGGFPGAGVEDYARAFLPDEGGDVGADGCVVGC